MGSESYIQVRSIYQIQLSSISVRAEESKLRYAMRDLSDRVRRYEPQK